MYITQVDNITESDEVTEHIAQVENISESDETPEIQELPETKPDIEELESYQTRATTKSKQTPPAFGSTRSKKPTQTEEDLHLVVIL